MPPPPSRTATSVEERSRGSAEPPAPFEPGAGRAELARGIARLRDGLQRWVPISYGVLCVLPFAAFLVAVRDPFATPTLNYVYPYIDLDAEANVATWYSSALLLLCALAATALVVAQRAGGWRTWMLQAIAALLFLYLSMDETGRLHEFFDVMLAQRMAGAISGDEVPHAARVWALFALPLLAALGVLFLVPSRRLTRKASACFLLGFGAWVLGLALEVGMGAPLWAMQRLTLYRLEVLVEETAEVAGTFLFLIGLLHALEAQLRSGGGPLENVHGSG